MQKRGFEPCHGTDFSPLSANPFSKLLNLGCDDSRPKFRGRALKKKSVKQGVSNIPPLSLGGEYAVPKSAGYGLNGALLDPQLESHLNVPFRVSNSTFHVAAPG